MNRIQALKEVREKIEELSEYLQEPDQKHAMQIADPYWDTECFPDLVNSADETLQWINKELEKEMADADFRENALLPVEGNPGVAVGG